MFRPLIRHPFIKNAALWGCAALIAGASPGLARAQASQPNNPAPAQQPGSAQATASKLPSGKRRVSQDVQVSGDQLWVETGIKIEPGEHIVATSTGKMHYAGSPDDASPAGLARGFKDLLRILPYNAAGRGAVIGRVGDASVAQPFLIGASCNVISYSGGLLSVGINQMSIGEGDGNYSVRLTVYAPDPSFVAVRQVERLPGIDPALFAKIPRRIADKTGDPGDMVNLLIIGSESAMQKVFATAGWVKVDADVRDAFLHGLMESMSKESYLTMPMSTLYLYGRAQDYGFAHAEPIQVVMARNHLRAWKAPFRIDGHVAWVGAATHDVGFERDQRNNGWTHRIDPDVDIERNYVEKTLTSTGLVTEVEHYLPDNPLKQAKTATGGSFYSDGHVLILKLNDDAGKTSIGSGSR
jgi:LssY C-terminus